MFFQELKTFTENAFKEYGDNGNKIDIHVSMFPFKATI